MNDVRAAETDIGALDHAAELMLGHAGLGAADERRHAGVAERRADAQPGNLLVGFVDAQLDVVAVQADDLELGLERLPARPGERPDHPDALCPAPAEFVDHRDDALLLAPDDVHAAGEHSRLRHVVVVLHMHRHLFARLEDEQRLRGAWPAGDPARRVADVLRADDQHVVDAVPFHDLRQRAVPARIFHIGEARVVLLQHRSQFGRQAEHVGGGRAGHALHPLRLPQGIGWLRRSSSRGTRARDQLAELTSIHRALPWRNRDTSGDVRL